MDAYLHIVEVWETERWGAKNKVFNVFWYQDGRLEVMVNHPGPWHGTLRLLASACRV